MLFSSSITVIYACTLGVLPDVSVERDLVYAERNDVTLRADVYRPRAGAANPGILMLHGGAWMAGSKAVMGHHARRAAARGYVVVSADYRLAPRHKHPAQLQDCRVALEWMRRQAKVLRLDPDHIAAYGYSAGAHLATLLAVARTDGGPTQPVCAVVAGGAPCDLRSHAPWSNGLIYWLGASRYDKPELYRVASPITHVDSRSPPMFFYHGELDRVVPSRAARPMFDRLQAAGIPARWRTIDQRGHLGAFWHPDTVDEALAFLDEVIKGPVPDRGPTPSE